MSYYDDRNDADTSSSSRAAPRRWDEASFRFASPRMASYAGQLQRDTRGQVEAVDSVPTTSSIHSAVSTTVTDGLTLSHSMHAEMLRSQDQADLEAKISVSTSISGARFTKYLTIYHKIILSLS